MGRLRQTHAAQCNEGDSNEPENTAWNAVSDFRKRKIVGTVLLHLLTRQMYSLQVSQILTKGCEK